MKGAEKGGAMDERHPVIASEAGLTLRTLDDVAEVIGACFGADGLLLTEGELGPAFFDLRTGLAGELFQKATNYDLRLALVLPDPSAYGARFGELAYEHRHHPLIRFFGLHEEATAWLQTARSR